MKKIYLYHNACCSPVADFLANLPPKQLAKVERSLLMLCHFPRSYGKPHVKHFQIERYRALYELREKCGSTLIRMIFLHDEQDNIILLEPFLKSHSRATSKALERALEHLEQIRASSGAFLVEYKIKGARENEKNI